MTGQGSREDGGSLRALSGVICPACRYHVAQPPEGKLIRCPHHPDLVLVSTSALADADGDPFLGMTIGGRFAVLEPLGAGSMGTVYRARQEAMGRDVALKIVRSERLVDPQAKGRFQQEAHATSLLTSPHTVTVFDFGEVNVEGSDPHFIDGSLFLAMELLDGESLGQRLKRLKKIAPADAVRTVKHALTSLAEAHDKGVIHRDLKPDNLLLTRTPTGDEEICKVLDFGIAKVLTHQGGIDALETQAGTVFGTPRYMSPEQAQGKALDARSDLYSLGVILYHMLLGRPPFTDGDAVVVMAHHIKTVPKRPNEADPDLGLPEDLEALLMRVLDKNPAKRPQSASGFIAELDDLGPLATQVASAELTAVVGRASKSGPKSARSQSRVMVAGIGVAVVLGLGTAVAVTGGGAESSATEGVAAAAAGVGLRVIGEAQKKLTEKAAAKAKSDAKREASGDGDGRSGDGPADGSDGDGGGDSKSQQKAPQNPNKKRGYTRFDR